MEHLKKLFRVADQFAVQSLRGFAEINLANCILDIGNAAELLDFAENNNARVLGEAATSCVVENAGKVADTDGYGEFIVTSPVLLRRLFETQNRIGGGARVARRSRSSSLGE